MSGDDGVLASGTGNDSGSGNGDDGSEAAELICSRCKGAIDSAWPDPPNGDVCQECWEFLCSESWWDTFGGTRRATA